MKRKHLLLLLFGLGTLISATTAREDDNIQQAHKNGFEWEPIDIHGKKYISFDKLKAFYQLEEAERKNKLISLEGKGVQINFTSGTQAITINKVKFLLSEPVRKNNDIAYVSILDLRSLIDPVLRPSFIKNAKAVNTVILDPGHGGSDQGSANLEANYTLIIVKKIRNLLTKKGYRVVLTRDKDSTLGLEERVKIAQREPNAIFISLHFNSGVKSAHGMETFIISAREPHPSSAASIALATAIHSRSLLYLNDKRYGHEFDIKDRGIRHAKFRLLKDSPHPAILIEAGFLTNKEEAAKIQTEAYQNTLAKSLVRGIEVYRTSIKK